MRKRRRKVEPRLGNGVFSQTQAHNAVRSAIKMGELKRQPCEVCGNEKSQAHHDDYSKPLDVRWLCQKHHYEHHKLHGFTQRRPNQPKFTVLDLLAYEMNYQKYQNEETNVL